MPGSQQTTVKGGNLSYPSVPYSQTPPVNCPVVISSSPLCGSQHDWQAKTELAGGLSGRQFGHGLLPGPPCHGVPPSY